MRFYNISITNDDGSPFAFKSLSGLSIPGATLTSLLPSGYANPAALQVIFNVHQFPLHQPGGNTLLQIWGLGVQDLGSAQDLNGKHVTISAGMSQGLPLVNPQEQGVLVSGKIWQAYGNWVGTQQTIDMQIYPDTGTISEPKNFSFLWSSKTQMANMISTTLSAAMPNVPQDINISPNLVLPHDEAGYYSTLTQFAQAVYQISKSINTDPLYQGVQIAYSGQKIKVYDGTTATAAAKYIQQQDLIGQPTWYQPATISIKTVLRGDLDISDIIVIPETLFSVNLESQSQAFLPGSQTAQTNQQYPYRVQDRLTFTGFFKIIDLQHYGNFRQSDAASWNTTIQALYQQPQASGTA